MSKLNDIGIKYGTDKSSLLHDYLEKYERFFENPEKIKKVVEIGLRRGGVWRNEYQMPSLMMWGAFFPNAYLYGFDLRNLNAPNDRITFYRGDQSNMDDLVRFSNIIGSEIDFIIDDGSHVASHQLFGFLYLFDKLKKGGIYIIEDCNAVVQKKYPKQERIHSIIKPYLTGLMHYWVSSDSAGEKSSLVIVK